MSEGIKDKFVDGFLQKPINLDDLRTEVHKQLHTYESQKQ